MDIDKIKTIVEMMSEHDISEFKIESKDSNLCIKRGAGAPVIQHHVTQPPLPQVQQIAPQQPNQQQQSATTAADAQKRAAAAHVGCPAAEKIKGKSGRQN